MIVSRRCLQAMAFAVTSKTQHSFELETLQDRLCAAVDTARADAGSTTRSLGFARRLRRRARHDASSNLGPPNFQEAAFAFSPSFETKPAFRPRAGKPTTEACHDLAYPDDACDGEGRRARVADAERQAGTRPRTWSSPAVP